MDAILDLWPLAFRDSLFLIGAVCLIGGIIIRKTGGNGRGLGMAVALVGVLLLVLAPLGMVMSWW